MSLSHSKEILVGSEEVTGYDEIISMELQAWVCSGDFFSSKPGMKWLETTDEHIKGRTKMESGILTKTGVPLLYVRGNQ